MVDSEASLVATGLAEIEEVGSIGTEADLAEAEVKKEGLLRCMMQLALNAEKVVRFHLDQRGDLFIAVIVLNKMKVLAIILAQEIKAEQINQGRLHNNLIRLMLNLIRYFKFYKT